MRRREVLLRLVTGPRTGVELEKEIPAHWWHGSIVFELFEMEMQELIVSTPGSSDIAPRTYRLTYNGQRAARAAGIALAPDVYRRGD